MGNAHYIAATLLLVAGVALADLDSSQTKLLADANKLLDQAQANLKVAKDGLGSGPVNASKAKLALTRLAPVKGALQQADARLTKLPADASVDQAKERSAAIAGEVKQIEDALTAPPKPEAPKPDAAKDPASADKPAAPAGGTKKLDYKQDEQLKNARFHTRDVTGKAAALAQFTETVAKAEDTNIVPVGQMQAAINTIDDARRKIKNAADHLAALPADGAGVGEVAADLQAATASVDASEKIVRPAYDKLIKALDPASHPNMDVDLKRLSELAAMYANLDILQSDRARAAVCATEIAEATKERDRIVKAYALLMHQQTEQGKRFTGTSSHFDEKLAAFQAAAKEQQASLPGQIDADLADATKLADQAAAEQKPAFFNGGIPQHMDFAKDKLILLAALDPAAGKAASAKIEQAAEQMKSRQAALREGIILANDLPPDRYQGADRAKLEQLATDAWKKVQPDAQVLMIRIPSQNWTRETMWRYQNSWYFIDRSKLQAQLLIKHDDKLAVNRPINLWIDHTKNDEFTAFPMDAKADELQPQRFLLLEKVK